MKISGILFDKDGTLLDFHKFWIPAALRVIKRILSDYRMPNTSLYMETALHSIGIVQNRVLSDGSFAWKTYRDIAIDLKSALETLQTGLHIDVNEMEEKLMWYFEEEAIAGNKNIVGTADLPVIFQSMRENGVQVGIATTDTYRATIKCLKELRILPFFSFFAADQMPEPMPLKPDGRIILRAAEQWCIAAESILVVGDARSDMEFAHNGGAIAVGVLSGVSAREQLEPSADYILDSVADIPALIHQLEQKSQ